MYLMQQRKWFLILVLLENERGYLRTKNKYKGIRKVNQSLALTSGLTLISGHSLSYQSTNILIPA